MDAIVTDAYVRSAVAQTTWLAIRSTGGDFLGAGCYKAGLAVKSRPISALVTDYERKAAFARAPYL